MKPRSSIRKEIQSTEFSYEGDYGKIETGGAFAWYIATLVFIIIMLVLYIRFQKVVHSGVKKGYKRTANIFKRKKKK